MLGRSWWCLLIGLLLAHGMAAGQEENRDSPVRMVQPDGGLVAPRPFPPFRRPIPGPPIITNPGGFGFPQLTRAAGIIFAGSVARVQRVPANPGQAMEAVAITFRVDSAIRGVAAGKE